MVQKPKGKTVTADGSTPDYEPSSERDRTLTRQNVVSYNVNPRYGVKRGYDDGIL